MCKNSRPVDDEKYGKIKLFCIDVIIYPNYISYISIGTPIRLGKFQFDLSQEKWRRCKIPKQGRTCIFPGKPSRRWRLCGDTVWRSYQRPRISEALAKKLLSLFLYWKIVAGHVWKFPQIQDGKNSRGGADLLQSTLIVRPLRENVCEEQCEEKITSQSIQREWPTSRDCERGQRSEWLTSCNLLKILRANRRIIGPINDRRCRS